MPSVRTDSQPMNVPASVAMASASVTPTHHGQPRLISAVPLVPKMPTM